MQLRAERYDSRTITLHWISAALIVLMWGGAHAIDWFPRGPLRVDARSVHIVNGCALIAVIACRLVWRSSGGVSFADAGAPLGRLAKAGHGLLYALVVEVLLLGLFNTWVRGGDLFGRGHIPQVGSSDAAARHQLANQIVGWHRLAANAVLVMASGHALMALYHRFVLRDGVLARMLP